MGRCLRFQSSHIPFLLSKSESLNLFWKKCMWSMLSLLLLWSRNSDKVLTSLKGSPVYSPSRMLYIVHFYRLSLRMFFSARSRISSLQYYPTNMSECSPSNTVSHTSNLQRTLSDQSFFCSLTKFARTLPRFYTKHVRTLFLTFRELALIFWNSYV